MNALWLESNQLSLRDLPLPARPGEALVKVLLAGICATDLELAKGYYPFTGVLGHEFVGEVVEYPSPTGPQAGEGLVLPSRISTAPAGGERDLSLAVGQRVVGEINAVCGRCEQCINGRSSHCENRTVLGIVNRDGAFAEFLSLPPENLHPVPDTVSDEAAVFAEPLAAALEIQEQVEIRPADRALVIGAGRLGQLVAQTLALTGCDLRVVARYDRQRELLQMRGIRPVEEAEVQPWRWDVVVEATGSPDGFKLARKAIRPRGTLVMKSTYKGALTVNLSSLVVDEITVVGSRCGPFGAALRVLENRQVDPLPLLSAEYPLSDGLTAFEAASQPAAMKILLRP